MRFNSSVISRMLASNSRSRRVAARSLISGRSSSGCGKAFRSGTIQTPSFASLLYLKPR